MMTDATQLRRGGVLHIADVSLRFTDDSPQQMQQHGFKLLSQKLIPPYKLFTFGARNVTDANRFGCCSIRTDHNFVRVG